MNGINFDPGLRQAFTEQTYQRLLTESTQSRMAKSVTTKGHDRSEVKQYTLRLKIKVIAQVIKEAGLTIVTILRASSYPANA